MIIITAEAWRLAAVFLGIALLLSFYALYRARLQSRALQEKFFKLAASANLYIFEYDIRKDELQLSAPCAELFGLPVCVPNYMEQAKKNSDRHQARAAAYFDAAMARQTGQVKLRIPLSDNSIGVFQVSNEFSYDQQGQLESIIGLFADVTAEFRHQEKLTVKAQVDALTKVYNSGTVRRMMADAITVAPVGTAALLILDVDHFKGVNDSLGHQSGDRVLQIVARSIKSVLRCSDIVGRLGGDEFCVYLAELPSYEFACEVCGRINHAVI